MLTCHQGGPRALATRVDGPAQGFLLRGRRGLSPIPPIGWSGAFPSSLRPALRSPCLLYHARLQSARSSGEHWAEERAKQPLGFEHAPQARAEPGRIATASVCGSRSSPSRISSFRFLARRGAICTPAHRAFRPPGTIVTPSGERTTGPHGLRGRGQVQVRQDSLHHFVARDARDDSRRPSHRGQWAGSMSSVRFISSAHGMYEVRERHVRVFGAGA
jgi:hypothetical protein